MDRKFMKIRIAGPGPGVGVLADGGPGSRAGGRTS